MKNITIILPIHEWNDDYRIMFENSIKSVEEFYNDVKLLIVGPKTVTSNINIISDKIESKILINKGTTDFCSQINLGIDNCDTEWFSILEIDDEYKSCWLKFMNIYSKENPTVDVFLPIVKDINVEGNFLSFTNEATWAHGFSEKQGFLDNEALLDYQNFQISGGLYRTSVIKEYGKLKDNIKLTFGYEFLLRLTHNNVSIMTIPKIGYQHVNFRENSLFWSYKNNDKLKISEEEVKFWLDIAKKEFFFKNKREIVNYVKN
jgi:hypothetical protein